MHLKEKYIEVRSRTEAICRPLQIEDYVPQPVPFASPPKWHLAHSTWFFEEMILKKHLGTYKEYHPDFGFLFNSYYNTIGERTFRADRGNITRPGVSEVYGYRAYVDREMMLLFEQELSLELKELIELGLNHEQQHQELLITDLKYTLGHNPIFPVYDETQNLLADHNKYSGWLPMEEGI